METNKIISNRINKLKEKKEENKIIVLASVKNDFYNSDPNNSRGLTAGYYEIAERGIKRI